MVPSLTSIFSILFLIYVAHSIWSLVAIFRVPNCDPIRQKDCYSSYLNDRPPLDLFLYTTTNPNGLDGTFIFSALDFNYDEPFESDVSINIPESVRRNGSLYVHAFVARSRNTAGSKKPPTLSQLFGTRNHAYLKRRLTKYALPRSQAFHLLSDETDEPSDPSRPVSHLKGRFVLLMCTDKLSVSHSNVPPELAGLMRISAERKILPIVQQDFMQTRQRDLLEITASSAEMHFTFGYVPTSIGKLRFLAQIEATLTSFLKLGFTEKDLDEIKGVFADTNLFLLCATMFIGSVHLLFDFLSFKNDVSFWRSNSSMAGLSTRTVLWRAFSQTVVFLFLLDEGTSLLVLIPSGIATLIEFWKVKKVLKASVSWRNGLPHVQLDKDNRETAEEAKTREYDEECMRYLSYVLYPLCIGAAIYSLMYQPHRSWYSWTINSLVNGVYAFGFLFMLPQLFVNYRLKSVAALPWRAFMYRAFNTFIDDIFAFIITMPTAHRVACFRDDIIFIIYLYQRWLYPVDKMRTDDAVTSSRKSTELEEEKKKK